MSTIDHSYYPHIIDLIWDHLDYEDQVVARAVCSEWTARADARLLHLVISCPQGKPPHVYDVSTRDLSRPNVPPAWLTETSRTLHRRPTRHPTHPVNEPGAHDLQRQRKLAAHFKANALDAVEVIDFVGFDLRSHAPLALGRNPFIRSILKEYGVVRWFGSPPDLTDLGGPYDYYNDPEEVELPPALVDVYMFSFQSNAPVSVLKWKDLVNRKRLQIIDYVCYSDPTGASPSLGPLIDVDSPSRSLCPVNIIFHNRIPPSYQSLPALDPGIVAAYGELVLGGNVVAIVGLEEFLNPKELRKFIKIVDREVIRGRWIDDDDGGQTWWVPNQSCLEDLCYWTHEEYRQHVGEETYRIRTVR
ncbi:hypothetical protein A1Q2_08460 [Trichosporon asahii var. asahii CBS 8904]|uniref:F-box domain-containing protein n=1 Tax=Trichosporon asahii var. asahii (strain CBS 8904) TaxID=1220162 RepID=K1VKD6_TRIAC|nr:hypothetical protein A1Q2_08460 [Trichosporon asahii var. asahii CBS 8904]